MLVDPAVTGVRDDFVESLIARVRTSGVPCVGVRPVTDTVKLVVGDLVGATVDRETLWQLVGPLVSLTPVAARDLAGAVAELGRVEFVEASEEVRVSLLPK